MFIYQGKLNWYNYAVDETFTIIFPKGVVRANDPIYIFTQWTKDASGIEKSKFFQTILVQDLKQLPKSTDVSFTLSGAWYNYTITTEQNYSKIKVDMTSPSGGKASTALERHWQPQGEINPNAALRIWAGSINWRENAVNEQAIFVLPEDYEDGKPIVSSWQWTKDGSGNAKTSAFKGTNMKVIGSDDKFDKFSFNNFFDITCAWSKETQKLTIEVKADGKQAEIGKLNLVAKVEPKKHSFDSEDLVPPTKKETEFRLPQPVQTLPRVLHAMPFPQTIMETLTHGVAFIEQAGYLTAQAQNKFAALDEDFHKQTVLVQSLKKDKQNLETQIVKLTDERNQANNKIDDLQNKLTKANEAYQNKVKELDDTIKGLQKHGEIDHTIMKKLQEDLNSLYSQNTDLQDQLTQAHIERDDLLEMLSGLHGQIIALNAKLLELENVLKVQKDENARLIKVNSCLDDDWKKALKANEILQSQLATAKKEHDKTKDELGKTSKSLKDTKAELDEKKAALQTKTNLLNQTTDKLTAAQKSLSQTTDELAATEKKLDGANARWRDRDHENEANKKKVTSLKRKIEEWDDIVNQLQDKCYDSGAKIDKINKKIDVLREAK
ncbi:hypothetical protein FPRO03_02967 [Fusarium proliferatum]|nr:hypothetical protein FPRO03_02967 [Fusarium proliferatum]